MQIEELTAGREAVRRSLYTALVNLLRMNGSLAPGSAREEQLDAHAAAQRAEVDRKRCDRIEFAAKFFEARARQLATTLLRDATDCGSHHVRGDLQMYSVTSADLRNAGASSATRSPLRVPSTVPPRSLHRASRAHRRRCGCAWRLLGGVGAARTSSTELAEYPREPLCSVFSRLLLVDVVDHAQRAAVRAALCIGGRRDVYLRAARALHRLQRVLGVLGGSIGKRPARQRTACRNPGLRYNPDYCVFLFHLSVDGRGKRLSIVLRLPLHIHI